MTRPSRPPVTPTSPARPVSPTPPSPARITYRVGRPPQLPKQRSLLAYALPILAVFAGAITAAMGLLALT